jgi:monoamine oxidase
MIPRKVAKLQTELNELIKYSPQSVSRIEHLKNQIELEFKRFLKAKQYCNELLKIVTIN